MRVDVGVGILVLTLAIFAVTAFTVTTVGDSKISPQADAPVTILKNVVSVCVCVSNVCTCVQTQTNTHKNKHTSLHEFKCILCFFLVVV